jgi:hypothetical protein
MESHYSVMQIEKIIFNSVIESKLQTGSYIPFLQINNKANEKHNLKARDLLKGYRSLQDKGLITNQIEIASGFFDYFYLKH